MNSRKGATAAARAACHWLRGNLDVLGILLLGILVRSVAFGHVPPGFNQDEAATAYDSWSVLKYGIDRNGFHAPVIFVSWGSGMYALNGYLAWPFMQIWGLNTVTARLPHLLLGIVSLPLMYFLAWKCTKNRTVALLAFFFLSAINPWHIMISRWGLDSNILPGCFLIAVYLLILALERACILALSAAFFAICLYLYGTAYVVVPVFLLISALALRTRWHFSWKNLAAAAAVVALVGLPVMLFVAINQFRWQSIELPFLSIPRLTGTPRYQEVSSVFGGNLLRAVPRNLLTFFDLLLWQDDGLIWNVFSPYGLLYPIGLPFVVIGIVAAIRNVWQKRGKHPLFFLLVWVFASVVLAALQPVNVNRINVIFLPLVFFMALGVHAASMRSRFLLSGIASVFLVFFAMFAYAYFTEYPSQVRAVFFEGLGKAITVASEKTVGPICVTDHVVMPYIFVLFFEETDPHTFIETVHYENPGAAFQDVSSFGRYTFGLHRRGEKRFGAYVLSQDEKWYFSDREFLIEDYQNYAIAVPIK